MLATQSPMTLKMILRWFEWAFGPNLPQTVYKPEESRMKIPSTWDAFLYFSEGSPPHCQDFLLGYGKFVHDVGEESLGLFGPKSSGTTGFSGSFLSHSEMSHRSKSRFTLGRSFLSIRLKLNTRGDQRLIWERETHTLLNALFCFIWPSDDFDCSKAGVKIQRVNSLAPRNHSRTLFLF